MLCVVINNLRFISATADIQSTVYTWCVSSVNASGLFNLYSAGFSWSMPSLSACYIHTVKFTQAHHIYALLTMRNTLCSTSSYTLLEGNHYCPVTSYCSRGANIIESGQHSNPQPRALQDNNIHDRQRAALAIEQCICGIFQHGPHAGYWPHTDQCTLVHIPPC